MTQGAAQRGMVLRWLAAVVILPVMVVFVIPVAILLLCGDTPWAHANAGPATAQFWGAILLAVIGLVLALWTMALFVRFGEGTAAPWDPPQRFIARGPYRHVRNPMMAGVFAILLAESLMLQSWPLLGWFVLFVVGNTVYMPLVEEPGLVKRFGEPYVTYKRHVRRWIPRLSPWGRGQRRTGA